MPFSAVCNKCGYRTYGLTYLEAARRIRYDHCDKSGHDPARDVHIDNCPQDEYDAWREGRDSPVYWYAVRNARQLVEADRAS